MDTSYGMNPNKPSLGCILQEHGDEFIKMFCCLLTMYQIKAIKKTLECLTFRSGYRSYYCPDCGRLKRIPFSCKSSLCPKCSARYTKTHAMDFVSKMLNVTHRHIVFTIPDALWDIFHGNERLQKGLLQAAYATIVETMKIYLHEEVMPGVLNVLHNYGRDLKKNCHVHAITSEGGRNKKGEWCKFNYFPYEKKGRIWITINEIWENKVLELLLKEYKNSPWIMGIVEDIRKRYPNGFYVYGPGKNHIKTNQGAYKKARYIMRYIRHPVISDSRIESYDGENVVFWYEQPSTQKRVYIKLEVMVFIQRVVQHIMPKGFHVCVRYGLYSSRYIGKGEVQMIFRSDGKVINPKHISWRESIYWHTAKDPLICEHCNEEMIHVCTVYRCRGGGRYHISYR